VSVGDSRNPTIFALASTKYFKWILVSSQVLVPIMRILFFTTSNQ